MTIQTVHRNPMGEVINTVSASAVRIVDDNGRYIEVWYDSEAGCFKVTHSAGAMIQVHEYTTIPCEIQLF